MQEIVGQMEQNAFLFFLFGMKDSNVYKANKRHTQHITIRYHAYSLYILFANCIHLKFILILFVKN